MTIAFNSLSADGSQTSTADDEDNRDEVIRDEITISSEESSMSDDTTSDENSGADLYEPMRNYRNFSLQGLFHSYLFSFHFITL